MSESEPTERMLLMGARSLGNTASRPNYIERARQCWQAMIRARDGGADEPIPSGGDNAILKREK